MWCPFRHTSSSILHLPVNISPALQNCPADFNLDVILPAASVFWKLPRTGKILGNGYFTAVFIPIGKRQTFPQGSRPLPPKKSCLFSYSVIDILSRRFDILSWMWGKIPSFFLTSGENSPMYPKVDMSKRTQFRPRWLPPGWRRAKAGNGVPATGRGQRGPSGFPAPI